MPHLSELQVKFPNADVVAGRCICFFRGRHYELGQYVGDGMVVIGPEGEQLMKSLEVKEEEAEVVAVRKEHRKPRKPQAPPDLNDDLTKLDL